MPPLIPGTDIAIGTGLPDYGSSTDTGSIWGQIGGFVTDLGNLGLNVYKAVNVPTVSAPKSTLPQGSVNTSGSIFGSGFSSLLLIVAVVFGGIFALKAIRK